MLPDAAPPPLRSLPKPPSGFEVGGGGKWIALVVAERPAELYLS